MNDYDLKKIDDSELLTRFLFARDTLVRVRMELFKNPDDKDYKQVFDVAEKEFDDLKREIYRRMKR